jgi:hypothetical protein
MQWGKGGVAALCAVAVGAAVLGNTRCGAGVAGSGSSGVGVPGGGGGVVIVARPWGRAGGVWTGVEGGKGYSWLAAAAAAGAAGKLITMIHVPSNEGRSVPAGGAATSAAGSHGYVPFASTSRCKYPGNSDDVVERWVWGSGAGKGIRYMVLRCQELNDSRTASGKQGKGHQILSCATWIFARGDEQAGAGSSVWEWNGARVEADTRTGRILSVLPGAAMTWAECASGGGGSGPAPA